jgi:hypothetical protein
LLASPGQGGSPATSGHLPGRHLGPRLADRLPLLGLRGPGLATPPPRCCRSPGWPTGRHRRLLLGTAGPPFAMAATSPPAELGTWPASGVPRRLAGHRDAGTPGRPVPRPHRYLESGTVAALPSAALRRRRCARRNSMSKVMPWSRAPRPPTREPWQPDAGSGRPRPGTGGPPVHPARESRAGWDRPRCPPDPTKRII